MNFPVLMLTLLKFAHFFLKMYTYVEKFDGNRTMVDSERSAKFVNKLDVDLDIILEELKELSS
ncbi:unnamed protein product [Tenebrio molitor]|nr:unnamed protein product [Tenebrio molitor]